MNDEPRHALPDSLTRRSAPARCAMAFAAAAVVASSSVAQVQFDELRGRLPTDNDRTLAVALGDVDGDGDPDLVVANSGQNRLYLNDGRGVFTDATAAHMPADNDDTSAVAFVDVDGDGDPDLILGNTYSGNGQQNRLYVNDGAGTFTDATAARLPTDLDVTSGVAIGDVDGDGDLDLVLANGFWLAGQQNRLYLNDGTGIYTDATATRMPLDLERTVAVALGDVDGDGDLDLVCGNMAWSWAPGGWNRLYLNDGGGVFRDFTGARLPTDHDATTAVALGDVDGDGDVDLVFGDLQGQGRLYRNDGTGRFSDVTSANMPTGGGSSLALGDLDGDGDLDLVFGNLPGRNRFYLNDGTGSFTDVTGVRMPPGDAQCVALADVDDDGDADLVVGRLPNRGNTGESRLYLNLLRQLDTPLGAFVGREYRLEAYARYGVPRASDIAYPFVSTAPARIPLPPLGTIGLDLTFIIPLPPIVIPQPAGLGSFSVVLPANPNLAGMTLYAQALLVQHPTLSRLTNVTADLIAR